MFRAQARGHVALHVDGRGGLADLRHLGGRQRQRETERESERERERERQTERQRDRQRHTQTHRDAEMLAC